jgi:hypothetical protein
VAVALSGLPNGYDCNRTVWSLVLCVTFDHRRTLVEASVAVPLVSASADQLAELYRASARRMVVGVYELTGDLGEAQEAVQEAFVRAVASPAPDPGRLLSPGR